MQQPRPRPSPSTRHGLPSAGAVGTLLAFAGTALVAGGAATPAAAQDGAECEAMGDTLAAAKGAYAEACPALPRLDCDPVIGGWACASYRIGDAAPSLPGTSAAAANTGPAPSAGAPGVGECRWIDATLETARAGYASMCVPEMRDCDPVPEGWMCASVRIGASMPGMTGGAVPDPVFVAPPSPSPASGDGDSGEEGGEGPGASPPPAPGDAPDGPGPGVPDGPSALEPELAPPPSPGAPAPARASVYDGRFGEPSVSWADSYSANGVCYASTTGDHGVYDLRVDTPSGRVSVREALGMIESGPGISRADALYNDIRCGRGPANDAGDEDADQCPGRVDQGRAGCGTVGPDWRFLN